MARLAVGSFSRRVNGPIEPVIVGGPVVVVTVVVIVTVDPPVVVVNVFVSVSVVVPCIVVCSIVVFSIVVFVVVVGVVVVSVVVVSVVVFADVASALVLPLTASNSVTTGGVTTENRPHFSKKARLSARSLSSSRTSSIMIAPNLGKLAGVAAPIKPRSL
jgi:hypothetical protein